MQVGAENRTKLFAMIVLAALGAFMLVRAFTASDNVTAAPSTPKPVPAGSVRSAAQLRRQTPATQAQSLDPTIRLDLLAASAVRKGIEQIGPAVVYHCAGSPHVSTSPSRSLRAHLIRWAR